MIENPILRGFCPDPSIIRVGEDYYIATSTFEWWPGVRLFHSKDLKHWEQIPSPLRRESQLNLIGDPPSGGVWAPCLSYDGHMFYLIYTDVKTKKGRFYNTHNYMVHTNDIYGEWSEPVYLNSIGFDPSLFHDRDGKKYLVNMVNGFKGILVQELALIEGNWQLTGERRKVYSGSGIGYTEGPHMYHIGDWYYLLVAEGGTGYDHCVTMARSKNLWGPYETAPHNPILTSHRNNPNALQKCGHGDLVETPAGEWYLVHLCSRPLDGEKSCPLGRETAIQKMQWTEDGWLQVEGGGRFAGLLAPEPKGCPKPKDLKQQEVPEQPESPVQPKNSVQQENPMQQVCLIQQNSPMQHSGFEMGIEDDFREKKLSVLYSSPRVSYDTFANLLARPGYLRLTGQESLNSLHHVSLVAVRQQEYHVTAETVMEFHPDYSEQMAGLAYMYDAMNFYLLGKTADKEGNPVLTLIKSDMGMVTDEISPIPLSGDEPLGLRVVTSADGREAVFYYRLGTDEWKQAGSSCSTYILTDEYCRGFTGAHFGMYIHDMTGLKYHADFKRFSVRYL